MHRVAVAVIALAALPLVGCIMIPLPPLGAQIGREEIEKLQPGVSTRADVHDRLGEPTRSVTERYEIFDVGRETAYLLIAVLYVGGGIDQIGAQDFRVLAEYRPDGVLQSLSWEGIVQDTDAPGGYSYISSAAPPTGPAATVKSPIGPQPILTWPAPTGTGYPIEVAAVTVSPEGPIVAISYGNLARLTRSDHAAQLANGCRLRSVRRSSGRLPVPGAAQCLGDELGHTRAAVNGVPERWPASRQHRRGCPRVRVGFGDPATRADIREALEAALGLRPYRGESAHQPGLGAVCADCRNRRRRRGHPSLERPERARALGDQALFIRSWLRELVPWSQYRQAGLVRRRADSGDLSKRRAGGCCPSLGYGHRGGARSLGDAGEDTAVVLPS